MSRNFFSGVKIGKFVDYSTIWCCVVDKLGYSMKVFQSVVKQQCEIDEIRFHQALEMLLQSCPERLVIIDKNTRIVIRLDSKEVGARRETRERWRMGGFRVVFATLLLSL